MERQNKSKVRKPRTTWMKDLNALHIETELGIINIRVGLHDLDLRDVESVELMPDENVLVVNAEGKQRTYERLRFVLKLATERN